MPPATVPRPDRACVSRTPRSKVKPRRESCFQQSPVWVQLVSEDNFSLKSTVFGRNSVVFCREVRNARFQRFGVKRNSKQKRCEWNKRLSWQRPWVLLMSENENVGNSDDRWHFETLFRTRTCIFLTQLRCWLKASKTNVQQLQNTTFAYRFTHQNTALITFGEFSKFWFLVFWIGNVVNIETPPCSDGD